MSTAKEGKLQPRMLLEHNDDCPLGENGLRAYFEALEAFIEAKDARKRELQ